MAARRSRHQARTGRHLTPVHARLHTHRGEKVPLPGDLLGHILVVPDDDYLVAARLQFGAQGFVPAALFGLVVDRAVAEDAYVRLVKEIGHAARCGDFALGIVGQAQALGSEDVQEAAFQVGAGVGERTQPGQVFGVGAPGDALQCEAMFGQLRALFEERMPGVL